MTEQERIEKLEKQVAELTEKLKTSNKKIVEWHNMAAYINQQVDDIFGNATSISGGYQFKSGITAIVGKCFRKNTVMAMTKEEIEEAKPFIDYVLNFARTTREKYKKKDAVSGHERKTE